MQSAGREWNAWELCHRGMGTFKIARRVVPGGQKTLNPAWNEKGTRNRRVKQHSTEEWYGPGFAILWNLGAVCLGVSPKTSVPRCAKLKNGPNDYTVLGKGKSARHVVNGSHHTDKGGDRWQENKPGGLMLRVREVRLQTSSRTWRRRLFCLSGGDQLKQHMGRGNRDPQRRQEREQSKCSHIKWDQIWAALHVLWLIDSRTLPSYKTLSPFIQNRSYSPREFSGL